MKSVPGLYAACIFAAAFLLFQVQPMVGKRILPWFGGAPGVWTLCLSFYQVVLFCGYGYAHWLTRRITPRRQPIVHAGLMLAAIASLPVLPGPEWRPGDAGAPTVRILVMLAANVGLPFLFLSASGPLIQAWFARALPGRQPYVLYSLSNAGSLLALLAYPFWIEPSLSLSRTATLWSIGFVAIGTAVIGCAWLARRSELSGAPRVPDAQARVAGARLEPQRGAVCALLSACAVVLLMGVTNELCLDVASVPFLWVAPLGIYLTTFIVAFSAEAAYPRRLVAGLALAALATLTLAKSGALPAIGGGIGAAEIGPLIALHSLVLFSHCLLLHGELYRLRPGPEALTGYYLWISFGGALGGLFVGIAAPRLFVDYYEVPLALCATWVLAGGLWLWRSGWLGEPRQRLLAASASVLAGSLAFALLVNTAPSRRGAVVLQERNFFGVLRLLERAADSRQLRRFELVSGTTLHGVYFTNPPLSSQPTLYYSRGTGIGYAMRARAKDVPSEIGVVGLGVGTLAAYGRAGDRFRFYEIDPDVVRIARDARHFRYLADSEAQIEIRIGDGRLGLAADRLAEAPRFDVLVLDAFSSDAIPVHLLTAEAFAIYDASLRDDGILAVHVSNANLELARLALRQGSDRGLHGIQIQNLRVPGPLQGRASWVLLSRDVRRIDALEESVLADHARSRAVPKDPVLWRPMQRRLQHLRPWTDDYSDLFQLLRGRAGAG